MPGASAEKPPLERVGVSSVGVTGFEPATSSSRTTRATKLRHTPMVLWTSTSITPSARPLWPGRSRPCVGRACRDPVRSGWSRPLRRSRGFDKLNQRMVATLRWSSLSRPLEERGGRDPCVGREVSTSSTSEWWGPCGPLRWSRGFDKLNQRVVATLRTPASVLKFRQAQPASGGDPYVGRACRGRAELVEADPVRGRVSRPEQPGPPSVWPGSPPVPPSRPRRRPCRPGWPGCRTQGSSP
jgi:hypothetical protein